MHDINAIKVLNKNLYNLESKVNKTIITLKLIDISYDVDYRKKFCFEANHCCCSIKKNNSIIFRIYFNMETHKSKIKFFMKKDCFPSKPKKLVSEQQLNYYLNLLLECDI